MAREKPPKNPWWMWKRSPTFTGKPKYVISAELPYIMPWADDAYYYELEDLKDEVTDQLVDAERAQLEIFPLGSMARIRAHGERDNGKVYEFILTPPLVMFALLNDRPCWLLPMIFEMNQEFMIGNPATITSKSKMETFTVKELHEMRGGPFNDDAEEISAALDSYMQSGVPDPRFIT